MNRGMRGFLDKNTIATLEKVPVQLARRPNEDISEEGEEAARMFPQGGAIEDEERNKKRVG
jgi:hypothetical protein